MESLGKAPIFAEPAADQPYGVRILPVSCNPTINSPSEIRKGSGFYALDDLMCMKVAPVIIPTPVRHSPTVGIAFICRS